MTTSYNTHTPPKKYSREICARCGADWKLCTWHHVDMRRYSDRWVWLCVEPLNRNCHQYVHDHPKKAREEGFYEKMKNLKTFT